MDTIFTHLYTINVNVLRQIVQQLADQPHFTVAKYKAKPQLLKANYTLYTSFLHGSNPTVETLTPVLF